jgi:hypothetical protein
MDAHVRLCGRTLQEVMFSPSMRRVIGNAMPDDIRQEASLQRRGVEIMLFLSSAKDHRRRYSRLRHF